jgi:hypothetical protein
MADASPLVPFEKRVEIDPLVPTIFHEPWWLDTVTLGNWKCVESKKNGHIVGRWPFVLNNRILFSTSGMPALTHFLGPAIHPGNGSPNTKFLSQLAITRDMIGQLPTLASFNQKLHRGIEDVIAFQMEGFQTSVQFTHEISPKPIQDIWSGMRDKTRNVMRQARKIYTVDRNATPEEFCAFYSANLRARNRADFVDLRIARNIITQSRARQKGEIFVARNAAGEPKAAIFCVWDASVYYYLLSTRALDSGNGAITLLLWHAIQHAVSQDLIFDFDGFGYSGAVLFYAGFGARVRPRYIVSRAKPYFRILREIRSNLLYPDNAFT